MYSIIRPILKGHRHGHRHNHHPNLLLNHHWCCSSLLILLITIGLLQQSVVDCRRQPQTKPPQTQPEFESDDYPSNSAEIEEFDDFDCPEKFGYFADTQNCSRYHICDHGKARLKACDDGLVFSTILKTCDWPYNVHCNLANGDRGEHTARHLRLRGEDGEGEDLAISNRRQPVLSNEADDSYWLGRPEAERLLAYLHDDDYSNDHYNEERYVDDIPRRPVSNRNRRPQTQPEDETPSNDAEKPDQPWFQNVPFERRRPTQSNQPTSTSSPQHLSTNQRGSTGWRTGHRTRPSTTPTSTASRPTAPPTVTPSMLPRKPLRINGNAGDDGLDEDYLLTDGPDGAGAVTNVDNDLDYQRRPAQPTIGGASGNTLKDDRDSYRIVSHNRPSSTPTTSTVRYPPWTLAQTTPAAPQSTPIQIGSRPRHLGTSVRRKVIRKKIISHQPTTTPKTITTMTTTTTTTTPAPSRNQAYNFWNPNINNNDDPWKSFRYEMVNRNNNANNQANRTPVQNNGPQHISSVRRTIPKVEHRQRFERKPVLRDPEESDETPHGLRNGLHDDEDDSFFYNTPEIVRNRSSGRNITNVFDNDLLTPTRVKDVSNSLATGGIHKANGQTSPPPTTTTTSIRNNQQLNKAFDIGFHHAINPNGHNHRTAFAPPNPVVATDIEYEDVENEDEDENVDEADGNVDDSDSDHGSHHRTSLNNNNREIVVRYDDDTDDDHPRRIAAHHNLTSTGGRFVTSLPRNRNNNNIAQPPTSSTGSSSFRSVTPTPPRFTRLIGDGVPGTNFNSFNNISSSFHKQHPNNKLSNSAFRILDLTAPPVTSSLHHHHSSHDHLPNPVPFVTIIGPFKTNKTSHSSALPPVLNDNNLRPFNLPNSVAAGLSLHNAAPTTTARSVGSGSLAISPNDFNSPPLGGWIPPKPYGDYDDSVSDQYNQLLHTRNKPVQTMKIKKVNKKLLNNQKPMVIMKQPNGGGEPVLHTYNKLKKYYKTNNSRLHQGMYYPRAKRCIPEKCQPPNCRCGGIDVPGGFKPKDIPQIVLLTFDDSVNDLNLQIYRRLFEQGRTNPNGCPISATFYVSHEWTDYSQVQNLYAKGHEIASHSISHSFGEKFSKERWLDEIMGQKEILHLYGGVDAHEIRGMRAPFLQTGGDTMFEMLHQANFSYDSSLPVYDIDPPYWPYTLDYSIAHDCMIEPCPSNSYPGFWEVGMVMWEDLRGGRCSMADGCFNPSDENGVYEMVKANFLRHYTSNRAPFGMFFHSRWFLTEHNMNGFVRFLDEMLQLDDIYLVTNWQMIQWMRHPTPLSHIKKFQPFQCDYIKERPPLCKQPHTCKARFRGEVRTLKTCQACPNSYPWTGNNGS